MNDVELNACIDKRRVGWRYSCFLQRIRRARVDWGKFRRGSRREIIGKWRFIDEGILHLGLVGAPRIVATTRRRAC
jgi:hypothetical protein